VSSNTRRSFFRTFLDNWSRDSNCESPNLTSSGDNTRGDLWRFALTRTPVLGPLFPPVSTGMPEKLDCGHKTPSARRVRTRLRHRYASSSQIQSRAHNLNLRMLIARAVFTSFMSHGFHYSRQTRWLAPKPHGTLLLMVDRTDWQGRSVFRIFGGQPGLRTSRRPTYVWDMPRVEIGDV
jgi:hypothetical protein